VSHQDSDRVQIRDDGAAREARPGKPCCARIGPGQWCVRESGHAGACGTESPPASYIAPTFLPRSKP
jgi:hypothetical protein